MSSRLLFVVLAAAVAAGVLALGAAHAGPFSQQSSPSHTIYCQKGAGLPVGFEQGPGLPAGCPPGFRPVSG